MGDAFEQLAKFCYKHTLTVPLRTGPGTFKDVYLKCVSRTDADVMRILEWYRLLGHPRKGDLFLEI